MRNILVITTVPRYMFIFEMVSHCIAAVRTINLWRVLRRSTYNSHLVRYMYTLTDVHVNIDIGHPLGQRLTFCCQYCCPSVDKWRCCDVILLIGPTWLPTIGSMLVQRFKPNKPFVGQRIGYGQHWFDMI